MDEWAVIVMDEWASADAFDWELMAAGFDLDPNSDPEEAGFDLDFQEAGEQFDEPWRGPFLTQSSWEQFKEETGGYQEVEVGGSMCGGEPRATGSRSESLCAARSCYHSPRERLVLL